MNRSDRIPPCGIRASALVLVLVLNPALARADTFFVKTVPELHAALDVAGPGDDIVMQNNGVPGVKSNGNTYHKNAFVRCAGTLTLRVGNDTTVTDNIFLGDGAAPAATSPVTGRRT